jgi:putative transposase
MGHVWYDRFKSVVVQTRRQWIATFVYVSTNPVRAGIVARPAQYQYNGITFLARRDFSVLKPPDALTESLARFLM